MLFLRIWIFFFIAAGKLDWTTHAKSIVNGFGVLNHTNVKRARHGCPPLLWNDHLSEDCRHYAARLGKQGIAAYSNLTSDLYSENLCRFGIKSNALLLCVEKWYSGDRFDMLDSKAREFTTMIWRSSQYMGYGDAMINSKEAIMVVRYSPAGNVEGHYAYNVPPLLAKYREKKDMKGKKSKKNCAIRQAPSRNSLIPFTILIYQLLVSAF